MSDFNTYYEAAKVYNKIVNALNNMGWTFDRDDEKLVISTGSSSNDIPINYTIEVDPDYYTVILRSYMPFVMCEEKRVEGAVAVCIANYGLINGSFDYDFYKGQISFRLSQKYYDSELGEDLFRHMITVASSTIDKYNDRFLLISNGALSLGQFAEQDGYRF